MKDQIVCKLRNALCDDIKKEGDVLYILAESRKLLETDRDQLYFALRLYCHWALHVDLTKPKTTLPFLERVDRFAASVLSGKIDVVEELRMFREFVFLDEFRKQFSQFLESYGLPTAVCDEDPRWHAFLKLYAGIIEDGSLHCHADDKGLELVDGVTFTKGMSATAPDAYVPFYLSWKIWLRDGRSMTVEGNAAPVLGGVMIVNGVG